APTSSNASALLCASRAAASLLATKCWRAGSAARASTLATSLPPSPASAAIPSKRGKRCTRARPLIQRCREVGPAVALRATAPRMGVRRQLSDGQWAKVKAFLDADYKVGEPGQDDRNFIEAVIWWRRTGAPWRDLPEEFGPWKTVFNRFDRWSKNGKWNRLFAALRPISTPNGIASTARSTEHTSTPRVEKGG